MQTKGHSYCVVDDVSGPRVQVDFAPKRISQVGTPIKGGKQAYLDAVGECLRLNEGTELACLITPDVAADVFHSQSVPWGPIAEHFIERCCLAVRSFCEDTIREIAPDHVAEAICEFSAANYLRSTTRRLEAKLGEPLRPYKEGHISTLNSRRLMAGLQHLLSERQAGQDEH